MGILLYALQVARIWELTFLSAYFGGYITRASPPKLMEHLAYYIEFSKITVLKLEIAYICDLLSKNLTCLHNSGFEINAIEIYIG